MPTQRLDEKSLVKYLLGNLSEEEQVQVEDRAFTDADYLAALETAEADLIDGYVRGALSAAERRDFERRFLVSPQRRCKVEFARALARLTAESKANQASARERVSGWRALADLLRRWSPALQLAAATAALICVGGISWLTIQNAGLRSRLAAVENQRRDLANRERGLQQQLAEERARTAAPTAQTPNAPVSERARGPLLATLVFLPGLSRAGTALQTLPLNPSLQIARIEIQLEPRDDFSRYRAELRRRGNEVLSQDNLGRRRTSSGYSVFIDLPASALSPGEYELALKGVAEGQTTDVGFYYFRVQNR